MTLKALFLLPALFLQAAVAMSATPDYLGRGVKHFDLLTRGYSQKVIETQVEARNVRRICALMAAYGTMYEASGDKKYLDMSADIFVTAMNKWRANPSLMKGTDDFFATKHVAATAKLLKEKGRIKGEYDDVITAYADTHFQPGFVVDHNQAQERALGYVMMYNLLPNAPNRNAWREYTEAVWDFWYKNLDVDEAATNYGSIHINDILLIAKESNKEKLLKRPQIKAWFDRYRNQQAPSGFMPEYGDDYFFAYINWVVCFERIARLFDDPTYLDAAQKLFNVGYANLPSVNYTATFDMTRASEWSEIAELTLLPKMKKPLKPVEVSSLVTVRTDKNGKKDIPDQLLLASSRTAGVPFVMSDLYANGSHGHTNIRGTINYFEADNYPFFHGVQRHAVDGRCANTTVLVKQDDEGFPFAAKGSRSQTDKWFTDFIDFTPSTKISDTDPSMRGFVNITFRFQGKAGEQIYIDNVRLMGKKGELIIHDCNTLDNWPSVATLSDDAVSDKAIKVVLKNGGVHFVGLRVAKDFSLDDYQYVAMDWKHKTADNAPSSVMDFILRVHNKVILPGDEYVHSKVGTLFNFNTVTGAIAQNKGKDCFGEIVLDDHFLPETKLTRRILLTEEGVLILQDYITPSPAAKGYTTGSLWQLYRLGERGDNWFNSPGEGVSWYDGQDKLLKKELLVYFEPVAGRQYGSQAQEYTVKPTTVFAKQAATPGKAQSFVTIVIPHDRGLDMKDMTSKINSKTTGQKSAISLEVGGKRLIINMNADRTWSVARENIK